MLRHPCGSQVRSDRNCLPGFSFQGRVPIQRICICPGAVRRTYRSSHMPAVRPHSSSRVRACVVPHVRLHQRIRRRTGHHHRQQPFFFRAHQHHKNDAPGHALRRIPHVPARASLHGCMHPGCLFPRSRAGGTVIHHCLPVRVAPRRRERLRRKNGQGPMCFAVPAEAQVSQGAERQPTLWIIRGGETEPMLHHA